MLLLLAVLQCAATIVSLLDTNRGIVRILDFVREPSIYLSALLGVLALIVNKKRSWPTLLVLAVSAGINLWRIWPYTFIAPAQLPLPDEVDGMSCVRVLSLNVLQSNDQYDEVAALIEREDPGLLLLMETNETWMKALEPQLSSYPFILAEPLDNRYGMVFATRLNVERAQMIANTSSNTPTLYATATTEDGAQFEVIGLHPRPPLPGESTKMRDANIARAGARTPDRLDNVLAIGDFNDVPWSRTTSQFVSEGGYRDPRAGRGSFATFPAAYAFAGWPLDQIFVKNGVKVESFSLLEDVGSDHLPLAATVCAGPEFDNTPRFDTPVEPADAATSR